MIPRWNVVRRLKHLLSRFEYLERQNASLHQRYLYLSERLELLEYQCAEQQQQLNMLLVKPKRGRPRKPLTKTQPLTTKRDETPAERISNGLL